LQQNKTGKAQGGGILAHLMQTEKGELLYITT